MLQISWTIFKSFINSRLLAIQYVDDGTTYHIWTSDSLMSLYTRIPKDGGSDQTDFETNFKPTANASLPPKVNTYSSGFYDAVTTATNNTDLYTMIGSATKTVRILGITVTGNRTTSAAVDILLIKRSTASTGGTGFPIVLTPHDSANPAATTQPVIWTTSPTVLGTQVGGVVRVERMFLNAAATGISDKVQWTFGTNPAQAIVLRGAAQSLNINLNGVTIAGGSINIYITWTEE